MTVSELDRLHSQLSRLEGMFPGYRLEIVEGSIMMSPVRPHHAATIRLLWNALEDQVPEGWGFTSDVAFPFDDGNEFCPDLAVIPQEAVDENRSSYPPELIELVAEVVSPGSVRNDYETKDRKYAARGIAHYLIFDPYRVQCTTMWNPGPDGYRGRDVLKYGEPVVLETSLGRITLDTSRLPVDDPGRRES
ncbi:Uma2 family endonuclease [Streptomyces sp. NPDC059740]|uniref:Uma2 family endonuclease n=1 Tax=Streptomyces sp. NPDC059740 TaxID=3346926 RepID=UPI003658DAA7